MLICTDSILPSIPLPAFYLWLCQELCLASLPLRPRLSPSVFGTDGGTTCSGLIHRHWYSWPAPGHIPPSPSCPLPQPASGGGDGTAGAGWLWGSGTQRGWGTGGPNPRDARAGQGHPAGSQLLSLPGSPELASCRAVAGNKALPSRLQGESSERCLERAAGPWPGCPIRCWQQGAHSAMLLGFSCSAAAFPSAPTI